MSLVLKHPLENEGFNLASIIGAVAGVLAASLHVLELHLPDVTDLALESIALRTFLALCSVAACCLMIANRRPNNSTLQAVVRRWSLASLNGGIRAGYVSSVAMVGYGLGGLAVVAPFGTSGDTAGALGLVCLGALILLVAFLWFYALGSELGIVPQRMKVMAWLAVVSLTAVLAMADAFFVAMLATILVALALVSRRPRVTVGVRPSEPPL